VPVITHQKFLTVSRDMRVSALDLFTDYCDRYLKIIFIMYRRVQVEHNEGGHAHFALYSYILVIHDHLHDFFDALNLSTFSVNK
jgi:hypothetical protein